MTFLKNTAAAAALFLAVPVLAVQAAPSEPTAQEAPQRSKRGEGKGMNRLIETLGLNEAQAAEFAAIRAEFGSERGADRGVMKELRGQMKALWAEDPVDVDAIKSVAAELDALQDAKREQRIEMKAEMLAVLTPAQKELFVESMGKGHGR